MKKWDFVTNILKEEKKGLTIKPVKFNPINIRRTYGISLKFQEGNNIRETQIHYKMDAIHLYANDDDTHILELCKQQIYINEKSPDSIMEELADKCGKVLYPLHIKVDANGQLLGITNQPMIKQRWELAKKQLAKEFTGKEVQLLLKNMTEVVNDLKKMTVAILEHDWFFLYFLPLFFLLEKILK